MGRDLEADEAILAVGGVIHRPQDVTGVLNVGDDEPLVDLVDFTPLTHEVLNLRVVILAARNSFVENGGVRGDTPQPLCNDTPFQLAAGDLATGEIIQPVTLAIWDQLERGVHRRDSFITTISTAVFMISCADSPR
jgi:hypothetical protein